MVSELVISSERSHNCNIFRIRTVYIVCILYLFRIYVSVTVLCFCVVLLRNKGFVLKAYFLFSFSYKRIGTLSSFCLLTRVCVLNKQGV